nr:MAG TPA: hypothetical protein [Caudoviricetes sp.]
MRTKRQRSKDHSKQHFKMFHVKHACNITHQ